jgi:predicted dehydrogenase
MRVGIVGCGRIADAHAEQITRISGCTIVGVCDSEELMARQLYERFPVGAYFTQVEDLLRSTRPDVVHVTTPPESHYAIGQTCLDWGSHVYLEKPFTIDAAQAETLIELATERNLVITAGHDDQFTPAARRMRALVREGYLGGLPLHIESYYGYDLGDRDYAGEVLSDKRHWVRQLPGKLLHNNISHGISRIAEFLSGDSPTVVAHGFTSPRLQRAQETEIIDELRVIIDDGGGTTAYFTFSSQMRPVLKQLRLYGAHNGLCMDHDHQTLIKLRGARHKSYLNKFIPPWNFAGQYLMNSATNARLFWKSQFHMKSGMRFLIEAFYRAAHDQGPVPIAYREIVMTARIMDSIFSQITPEPAATPVAR